MQVKELNMPLMQNNITKEDRQVLIDFLGQDGVLTNGPQVRAFEKEWSEWLGVKYSVFVNSGASANLLTMALLAQNPMRRAEIIVPALTWVSDIATVILNGFTPVFVDVNPKTLGIDTEKAIKAITPHTEAIFVTHLLGFNAIDEYLLMEAEGRDIRIIEDCCESHGATTNNKKVGSGTLSNFSFYYAHHMTTIEGGMICTNSEEEYETLRMLRSHGLVREMDSSARKEEWKSKCPEVNTDFTFGVMGYNVRSTELNAVLGRHQLKRLDENNKKRVTNLDTFLDNLNALIYQVNFHREGNANYAFPLVLNHPNPDLVKKIEQLLTLCKVEFRRGLSGGGNQLRQPYLKARGYHFDPKDFPYVEHVHNYGWYIGNYPDLDRERIVELCELLNQLG